jgi:hypothetical protein
MISEEYANSFIKHREYLINILLNEKMVDHKCLDSKCKHDKICKSGTKIILDETNSIVDLKELKKGQLVDACMNSTLLATFINDIQFFKDIKKKIEEQKVANEFNKGQEEFEKQIKVTTIAK